MLIAKIPFLNSQKSSDDTALRFSHPFGQEHLELIYINKAGNTQIGLDLKLSELLGSNVLGELIEEYLLAYLLNCKLDSYTLKATIPQLSKPDLAAKINSLKSAIQLNMQKTDGKLIMVDIYNPQIKLKFEIPLSLIALYGKDKKDLEIELHRQITSTALSQQQYIPYYPDIEQLSPYRDSLYVWEKPALDSLFTAPLFFALQDSKLHHVFSPQYPLESLYNYLLIPRLLAPDLPVSLKHNLYGNSSKQVQIPFSALHSLLSQGMSTAVNISQIDQHKYAVMLLFYDSLTGVRHLLHGSFDADQLFCSQPKEIELTLYSYIIGDAEALHSPSYREPLWQINIK
ncbi:hypothetical protein MASR2M64_16080 [Candidatus Cloacimonadota bacterium]